MRRHWVPLLWTAAGLTFGNAVFAAIAGLTWPGRRYPDWAGQVNSAVFLLTAIVAGSAALGYWLEQRTRSRRRKSPEDQVM